VLQKKPQHLLHLKLLLLLLPQQLQFQPLLHLPLHLLHHLPLPLLHLPPLHLPPLKLHPLPLLFKPLLPLPLLQELHPLLVVLVILAHTTRELTLLRILRMHIVVQHHLLGKKDLNMYSKLLLVNSLSSLTEFLL
jgi:hypothetical protein